MSKFLVIAEKPSVAQSYAKNLSAYKREDGYLEGESCIVSWCLGHLAEYAQPEEYDPKYEKWQFDDLPILPEAWKLKVSKDKKKQFEVIKTLMNRSDVEYLVNGCDAGREGELIFQRVYVLAGCRKPVKRLWISSMEDAAIQKGFQTMKSEEEYKNLCMAAVCRAQADWLIGMNGTRAYTTRYFKRLVVGRVQTPTLAMLAERQERIEHFQKEAFYKVALTDAGYGYFKDPKDKNHLVIDEYAAEIVRMIFNMKIDGYSAKNIAARLNEMGVLIPAEYKRACGFNYSSGFMAGKKPKWDVSSVLRILKNELYTGTMVQGKTRKINYKVNVRQKIEPENWIRVEGTHEPIVSKEIFECVQKLMELDTRTSPEEESIYEFSGLLRCGDCGQNLVRRTTTKKGKKYFYYHCSTYKRKEGCSSHNISDIKLRKAVLEAIRSQVALIVKADEIIAQIENLPQQQFGVKILDTQMKTLHKEIQKYEELKANLYQDMVDKIISREEYRELKQNFSKKIENAKVSMKGLEEKKKRMLSNEMRTQQWVTEFKQYRNIKSLDRKTVVMLIDRIVVYSTDRIEIHFNYEDEITEFVKYAFANGDLLRKVGEL